MVAANLNEPEWDALAPDARARAVAHLRLTRLIALHENEAVSKKMKHARK